MPASIELRPLTDIDRRLSDLDDRPLIIALKQLGWDGLATNNYKMLNVPTELAAVLATKMTLICVEGMGQDAIRATGALLLELPGLPKRLRPGRENIFRVRHARCPPSDGWPYMKTIAGNLNIEPKALYEQVRVAEPELTSPVLGEI